MIQKAEVVVLKTINYGDTSRIITLYSRDAGRLKLIAKGVRSPKNKAAGLFQPTRHLQVIYYQKSDSELQLFKSGELINGFFGLENDFDRLTLAQVVVELLDRSIEDQEPHPELFDLLIDTLKRLSDKTVSPAHSYWFFHLHLLQKLGFRPRTEKCSVCQESLGEGGFLGLSGHLECVKCHNPTSGSVLMSGFVLDAIQQLLGSAWDNTAGLKLKKHDRQVMWDFLWRHTFHHIESSKGMRSLKVLKQLYR